VTQYLGLYFDTIEGQYPELDVVARTAVAYSSALKRLALEIDPTFQIVVRIDGFSPGSLTLHSFVDEHGKIKVPTVTMAGLAVTTMMWFGAKTLDYGFNYFMDNWVNSQPEIVRISEEDIDKIAKKVVELNQNPRVQGYGEKVRIEASRDPTITGLGVTVTRGKKPLSIAREDLVYPFGLSQESNVLVPPPKLSTSKLGEERVRSIRTVLTIVKPALVVGKRAWRFSRYGEGEFSARVTDILFIDNLLAGIEFVPMVEGVQLDVVLEIHEQWNGDVWLIKKRLVTNVLQVKSPSIQGSLFPPTAPPP
jgi:hypothetical protein